MSCTHGSATGYQRAPPPRRLIRKLVARAFVRTHPQHQDEATRWGFNESYLCRCLTHIRVPAKVPVPGFGAPTTCKRSRSAHCMLRGRRDFLLPSCSSGSQIACLNGFKDSDHFSGCWSSAGVDLHARLVQIHHFFRTLLGYPSALKTPVNTMGCILILSTCWKGAGPCK